MNPRSPVPETGISGRYSLTKLSLLFAAWTTAPSDEGLKLVKIKDSRKAVS